MSTDERRLHDLFQEMLETRDDFQTGESDASETGLEDMLFLARELQTLGRASMPDAQAALARARERVLQSLPAAPPQTSPQPQPQQRIPFWQRWGAVMAPAMAWAPATLIAFLAMVILLAVSISVSASAMPDSPFYPVKRTTENVALHMAPAAKRAVIEAAIAHHRAEEIDYLQEKGIRAIVPSYEGEVRGCVENVCQIGPFQVTLPPDVAAKLRPGDRVKVDIEVHPGRLMALSVAPGKTPTPTSTVLVATENPNVLSPGATLESRPFDTPAVVRVTPTKKPVHKPTQRPTKKPTRVRTKATAKPTRQKPPSATPSRPRKASTATMAPLPPPQATPTPSPRPTIAPTATPAPTRPPKATPRATPRTKPGIGTATPVPRRSRVTPNPESRGDQIQAKKVIRGRINRIYRPRGRVVWVVIGRYRVYMTRNTKVVGRLVVGRQATARIYQKRGRWYATKITVRKPSSGSGTAPTPTPSGRKIKPKRPTPTPTPRPVGTRPPVRRP